MPKCLCPISALFFGRPDVGRLIGSFNSRCKACSTICMTHPFFILDIRGDANIRINIVKFYSSCRTFPVKNPIGIGFGDCICIVTAY